MANLLALNFFPLVLLLVLLGALVLFPVSLTRSARRFGYPSTRAYLRAAPRTDGEKRDAVDLAVKGLVFCVLAVLFPPLILAGLLPLFYGGRKLVYAALGLGLVDDGDELVS